MKTEYEFDLKDLDSQLASFSEKGITEFALHDNKICGDKNLLAEFLIKAQKHIPEVYISIPVEAKILDEKIISLCQELFCSLDIYFYAQTGLQNQNALPGADKKNGVQSGAHFDKKLLLKKSNALNNAGIVFGFLMDFALTAADSIKAFRERLDFAFTLYPNHIEFPQLYSAEREERRSATFSSQDINYAKTLAFAVEVFYSQGRAVPWFNSVLKPLKIPASKFFSDFAEWLCCNNCGFDAREKVQSLAHKEIEKMQLLFLEEKYEEKKLEHLFPVVRDEVCINGAFSRLEGEGEECTLDLSFNPDDLLSPSALDIVAFSENVCLEECRVKVFENRGELEYKTINN